MKLNSIPNYGSLHTKGALDLYQQKARQESKRAELERYFPGLYSGQKASFVDKGTKSRAKGTQKTKADFASELESQLRQKKLSRADIQKETQSDPEKKKLYQASLDFQALFIDRMLSAMRKNLNPKDDPLYGGFRQKVFEDMLYEEYSRMLSRTDNFGIADDIYRQGRATLGAAIKRP